MTVTDAYRVISHRLSTCAPAQADDLLACLRFGAGHIGLPEGATCDQPSGLVPERREAWLALVDAVRLSVVGPSEDAPPDAPWTPTTCGDWEPVLASLVIAGEWDEIATTAADLRGQQEARG